LDRLLDDDPRSAHDPPQHPAELLRRIKLAVTRDLQDLLNTRWRPESWGDQWSELDDSLVNYGIPDFAKLQDPLDYHLMCDSIRRAIERFEPRLKNVHVTPLSHPEALTRSLEFRIDAVLQVDPLTDEIAFSSVLEPATGSFQVRGAP
jgi:type VI secretion system protein ImpF